MEQATSIIPFTVNGVEVFSLREPPGFFASGPIPERSEEPSSGPTASPVQDESTFEPTPDNNTELISKPSDPSGETPVASSSVPGEGNMPEEGGLSGGALAGIIVAVLVGVGIGVFFVIKISKADNDVPATKSVETQDPDTAADSL